MTLTSSLESDAGRFPKMTADVDGVDLYGVFRLGHGGEGGTRLAQRPARRRRKTPSRWWGKGEGQGSADDEK